MHLNMASYGLRALVLQRISEEGNMKERLMFSAAEGGGLLFCVFGSFNLFVLLLLEPGKTPNFNQY